MRSSTREGCSKSQAGKSVPAKTYGAKCSSAAWKALRRSSSASGNWNSGEPDSSANSGGDMIEIPLACLRKRDRAGHDVAEHRPGEPPGLGVLAAGVVAVQKEARTGSPAMERAVGERRRARLAVLAAQAEAGVVSAPAEGEYH